MSNTDLKLAFIGGGNMGEAMIAAAIRRGLAQPGSIRVSDISEARLGLLRQQYGIETTTDNRQAIVGAELIVLAIKPQTLPTALPGLAGALRPGQLVLSIIAGARIENIAAGLRHAAIVRSMPNTPAQIGEGMTVWTATPQVTPHQRGQAQSLLGAMGREIYVADESYLDMATAVSGSGPAYFFLFAESLIEAAVRIGFTPEVARLLVVQTMIGSADLIRKTGKPPAELRRMVTSPGGTTARAIEKFESGNLPRLVLEAVQAALERARELGK